MTALAVTASPPVKTYGHLDYGTNQALGIAMYRIHAVPHVAQQMKRVFPRADQGTPGVIWMRDTPAVARDLEWFMTRWPLEADPASYLSAPGRAGRPAGAWESAYGSSRFLAGGAASGRPGRRAGPSCWRDRSKILATIPACAGVISAAAHLSSEISSAATVSCQTPTARAGYLPRPVALPFMCAQPMRLSLASFSEQRICPMRPGGSVRSAISPADKPSGCAASAPSIRSARDTPGSL